MEENKEKTAKQKRIRKPISRKKVLFIILSLVIAVIAIGGIVTAFILNYNVSAPNNLRIVDDGKNVYVAVDMNDNYLSYKFVFTSGENEIVIDSKKNILSIEELQEQGIELGQTYTVTVQYIAENQGNNSQISDPLTWTAYTYLDAPVIVHNIEGGMLGWSEIEYADYYIVYINGYEPIETTNAYYNLQDIDGGERSLYVVAMSNNESYRESLASNKLNIELFHTFMPFLSVSFDSNEKVLTIIGHEELEKINIHLDDMVYECENFDVVQSDNIYTYTVDISLFYQDNLSIGASPASIDEYNIYNGEVTYAEQ